MSSSGRTSGSESGNRAALVLDSLRLHLRSGGTQAHPVQGGAEGCRQLYSLWTGWRSTSRAETREWDVLLSHIAGWCDRQQGHQMTVVRVQTNKPVVTGRMDALALLINRHFANRDLHCVIMPPGSSPPFQCTSVSAHGTRCDKPEGHLSVHAASLSKTTTGWDETWR